MPSVESITPGKMQSVREVKLRAGERVRNYLLAEFACTSLKDGSRLPSNKELARRLNVSSRTVHSVLQDLAKEGKIRTKRGSGTYLVLDSEPSRKGLRILISVPLGEYKGHDLWTDQIGGGIFRAALNSQPPVILEGLNEKHWGTDGIVDELMAKCGICDGLILLPYSLAERHRFVLDTYAKAGKPVVRLHPPEVGATADFVSSDFFSSCLRLGEAWLKCGRKRVAMLTPFSGDTRNTGLQMRLAGLTCGLGKAIGQSVSFRIIENFPPENRLMDENAGYASMKHFLEVGNEAPDALFCMGDFVAHGAMRALLEAGLRIPEDVSVVGGAGIGFHGSANTPGLSCISQPLTRIGEALLDLLRRRIELKGISLPAVIINASFVPQSSTTAEENALLDRVFSAPPVSTS